MMTVYRILFPAIILSSLLGVAYQDQLNNSHLLLKLDEAEFKVSQLEYSLEQINQKINARDLYLAEREKQIQEMGNKLNDLQSYLSSLESCSSTSPVDEKIKLLEEEVRVLWANLRKNNFDIHVLESKAREAEDRLQSVTLQVEKMADIVSEQWIQIQQFEQALQLKEMRMSEYQRKMRASRCSFLKFMQDLSSKYLPKSVKQMDLHLYPEESILRSYMLHTVNLLKRLYSTAKESHHELQGLVKAELERHEFTALLANEELVFFLASALIIFPVLSAWMLLSSQLQS